MAAPVMKGNVPHIVEDRRMMSRTVANQLQIVGSIPPGAETPGCCVCCHAPACCPCMALCLCCDDPEYLVRKREASRYVTLRENSIEWNTPVVITKPGSCCGFDPCRYDIEDKVTVLYYDNVLFERLSNRTRCCNDCRTTLCGGRGQIVSIDSPICCGLCSRGTLPCPCVPICCPDACCPCKLKYDIYVESADSAIHEISEARASAKQRLGVD